MRLLPSICVLLVGCLVPPQPVAKLPEPPLSDAFQPWTGVPVRGDFTVWIRSVHDGDSFEACLLVPVKCRMMGIDAPELSEPAGKVSRDYLGKLIVGQHVPIRFYGPDKFGRTLADIKLGGEWISERMISSGNAKKWNGEGPRP